MMRKKTIAAEDGIRIRIEERIEIM